MRRDFLPAFALVIVGFFICTASALSADSDIVINEIGAYEPSGHEWIEIWNKGSDPVDLSSWIFWENSTNHHLNASTTDNIVLPGEYAVICQDESFFLTDYPEFVGSVFDSSWSSLNESGEDIGLKDGAGNIIEQFVYIAAPNYSLERIDPFKSIYDASNWKEHLSGNTVGLINSIFSTSTDPITPTSTPTSTPEISTSTLWNSIKINEIVSDPSVGNEWLELYNLNTSSLDVAGGYICDSRETTSTCKILSGVITAGGWMQFDLLTTSFLNNDGDSVILKSPEWMEIDRVDYAGSYSTDKGQALARKIDGIDTGSLGDWAKTTSLTPGAPNFITAPAVPVSGGGGGSTYIPPVQTPIIKQEEIAVPLVSSSIFINEIYPNPSGSDTEDEFIELKNSSTLAINLNGWKLSDMTRSYNLSGEIASGGIIYIRREISKISLNNTTKEQVKLIDGNGTVVDVIEYQSAKEAESYSRDGSAVWQWTAEPTPGLENIIKAGSVGGVVWKVNAPSSAEVGEMVLFDADDSADERGGLLSFHWAFSDNFFQSGSEVQRSFSASGTYEFIISASSTTGSSGVKKMSITIGSGLAQNDTGVSISEVLANPEGDDSAEFIELFNTGAARVDLSGWSMQINSGKKYVFPENTIIEPQSYLVFFRSVTGFALNNSEEKIRLVNRDGDVVDLAKIGKSESGKSFIMSLGEWLWSDVPTPGQINLRPAGELKAGDLVVKKSVSAKKVISYNSMTIREARAVEIGDGVKIRGVVTVLPGVFGSQYFYIMDETAGIQVYQYKKDFPELRTGDYVEIVGVISEANGARRVKVSGSAAIDILSTEKQIKPVAIDLQEIDEENGGSLVQVIGEITEIKTNYLYLDNGGGEVKIYLKKNAGVDKKLIKEGGSYILVGISEISKGEMQIWPRGNADIVFVSSSTKNVAGEKIVSDNESKSAAAKYFTIGIGIFSALMLGFIARGKGHLLKNILFFCVNIFKGK